MKASWDSSVAIQMDRGNIFYLLHTVQTSYGDHSAPYTVGTSGSLALVILPLGKWHTAESHSVKRQKKFACHVSVFLKAAKPMRAELITKRTLRRDERSVGC